MKGKRMVYALYKGDTFLDIGTAEELAIKFNVKKETIKFLASKSNYKRLEKRKDKSQKMVAVSVGFNDEEL